MSHDIHMIFSFRFCTVLEYVDGNDLDFVLKQQKSLPEREVTSIHVSIGDCVFPLPPPPPSCLSLSGKDNYSADHECSQISQ